LGEVVVAAAGDRHRPAGLVAQDDFAGHAGAQTADAGEGQAEARGQRLDIRDGAGGAQKASS
jgi:hypothetical protein